MLGVSRTLIREALSQLVAEGLVQIIPHKGPVVAILNLSDARGLYQVRAVLEELAGQRFTEWASNDMRVGLLKAQKTLLTIRDLSSTDKVLMYLRKSLSFTTCY
ncbi:GntR family transcriptional regulator [Caballeronia peredens]|nr:GntR family transcriptional regulator [Caballeronia peredens]